MAELNPKPDPFMPGEDQISAESLNKITRAVIRQIRGAGDSSVDYFGDRLVVSSKTIQPQLPAPDNYMTQFIVLEERADTLLCTPFLQPNASGLYIPQVYDPTLGIGTLAQMEVAKPYALQQSPWNGQTVGGVTYSYTSIGQRTGIGPQSILPTYVPGDVILAARTITGLYDQTLKVPVTWMDMNTAARAWATTIDLPLASFAIVSLNLPQTISPSVGYGDFGGFVGWDHEVYDPEGYFSPSTPYSGGTGFVSAFTSPADGTYLVGCNLIWSNSLVIDDSVYIAGYLIFQGASGIYTEKSSMFSPSWEPAQYDFETGQPLPTLLVSIPKDWSILVQTARQNNPGDGIAGQIQGANRCNFWIMKVQ